MDGPTGKRSELSQTNNVWFHLYVESKKQNKAKQKQTYGYREQTGGCQRGWGAGGKVK